MYTKPQFPGQIWDGDTNNPWRDGRGDSVTPDSKDWDRVVAEMIATQQVVKNLMEVGGGGNNPNVKIGWFLCPDTTGIYQVTDVGFKPKRVTFYVSEAPGAQKRSGAQKRFCCSTGLMDEFGNQSSMTWAGDKKRTRGDSSVNRAIHTANVKKIIVEASYVSMDDDGFTVDFLIVNSLFIVRWDAIG